MVFYFSKSKKCHDQAGHAKAGHAQAGHAQAGHAQAGHAQAGHYYMEFDTYVFPQTLQTFFEPSVLESGLVG